VKGRESVKRNQIIKTNTLNTFCGIQVLLNIYHCAFSLVGHAVYYNMLFHFTSRYWNIIRLMRLSCCITKATNIQSEHVTLITFPRQQWLHKRTSIRRYIHISCLVTYKEQNGYWFFVCRFCINCTALRHPVTVRDLYYVLK